MTVHVNGTRGTKRYTVPQMAQHLGITERAIRKRIERGSLAAKMVNGQYQITITDVPEEPNGDESVHIGRTAIGTSEPLRVRDNQGALIIREAIAPFVAELKTAHEEIGHLRTLLDLERERREATEEALKRYGHAEEAFFASTADKSPDPPQEAKRSVDGERPNNESVPSQKGAQSPEQSFWDRLKGIFIVGNR